jgi:hypothetical protein
MNVTFTSSNKKIIQYIVNYLYSKKLTAENISDHIKYLRDKWNVSMVVHDFPQQTGKHVQTTMKIVMNN